MGVSMTSIRGQVGRLEQQLLMDQETLVSLQHEDAQRIKRHVDVLGINPDEFSEYLLGREVGEWVTEAIGWIHWGRYFVPEMSERSRGRGHEVRISGSTVPFPALTFKLRIWSCEGPFL